MVVGCVGTEERRLEIGLLWERVARTLGSLAVVAGPSASVLPVRRSRR